MRSLVVLIRPSLLRLHTACVGICTEPYTQMSACIAGDFHTIEGTAPSLYRYRTEDGTPSSVLGRNVDCPAQPNPREENVHTRKRNLLVKGKLTAPRFSES